MGRKEEGKRRWKKERRKEIHVLKKKTQKTQKKGRISYLENPTFMS